ncbi:uncharacterized protein KD926_004227 [Aspergillus affinis]|uniref:uncharacterized protein n=1 Tax=Aspergillus affinis TaxID=1070780 RepID=UPI0022FE3E77|nr:uncharacterized protein KD926_004227 [Aspergillus affinis]KAI9035258.1 hypothetical protein KD926_004227 [Aspergillus affinis]
MPSNRATEGPDYDASPQLFVFRVGKDQTEYTVHSNPIERTSLPLGALINNGQMKESCSGVAVLEDVEPHIFVGFCEFAYSGTYKTPSLIGEPDDKGRRLGKVNSKPACSLRIEHFYSGRVQEKLEGSFDFLKYQTEPVATTHSHSPDLLFHAELYVFATKYLVEPLRQLCLSSLHRDLVAAERRSRPVGIILNLLEYTYAHTGNVEPGGESPLRELVTLFVASFAGSLYPEERFKEILRDNSEFGLALIQVLLNL